MKSRVGIIFAYILMLAFLLMNSGTALAWQEMHSDQMSPIVVEKAQVISDDLIVLGNEVTINGTVEGDLVCFAENVTVNGTVNGDIFCFCRDFSLKGTANDDVRVAAQSIRLAGPVKGSFSAGGNIIYLDKTALVGGNVTLGSEKAATATPITGSLTSFVRSFELGGVVGKDVTSFNQNLTIDSGTVIGGKLVYTSKQPANIAKDVKIAGGITHKLPPEPEQPQQKQSSTSGSLVWFLVTFASACLVWFVWRMISPQSLDYTERALKTSPWPAIGWGILLFFIVPLGCLIALFTVIGIPLSILTLTAYFAALYLGRIVVGVWLGHLIAERSGNPELLNRPNVMAALGILVVMLAAMVPVVGFWIKWVVSAICLGCAFIGLRDRLSTKNPEV